MTPIVVTPPARLPVTLAEVRAHMRMDHVEDDAQFAGLLSSATERAETWLNRALITRTLRATMDAWPVDSLGWTKTAIELPRAPLISVTSIKTYDDADVPTTLDASKYFVDTSNLVGRIVARNGQSWPTPTRVAAGIEIIWTAGYGPNPADVPEPIRLGIAVLAAWFSEQRGDETAPQDVPPAARALLEAYRIWTV